MAFCRKCGAQLKAGIGFCTKCGTPLGGEPRANQSPRPVSAKPVNKPGDTEDSVFEAVGGNLMKTVVKRLPLMLVSSVGGWALHTWLMAAKNHGYNPGSKWSAYLNVAGNTPSTMIIWGAASAMFWTVVIALFKSGPMGAVRAVASAPMRIIDMVRTGDTQQRAALLLGAGVALLLARFLPINPQASISLGIVWTYLGFSAAGQAIAQQAMRLLTQLGSSVFQKGSSSVGLRHAQTLVAGLAPGFILATMLGGQMRTLATLAAIGGGLWMLYGMRGPTTPATQPASLVVFALFAGAVSAILTPLFASIAWADDAGTDECEAAGVEWEDCEGADVVIKKGGAAGAGAGGGAGLAPLNDPRTRKKKRKRNPTPWVKPRQYVDGEGNTKDNPWDPSKEEQKEKWKDDSLIWDPKDQTWRKPRPEEYPPPQDPPEEEPPFARQNPRSNTPVECLGLYDDYVKAQGDLLQYEKLIEKAKKDFQNAQEWLQIKLTIFTVQFGVDMADFFTLGAGGIRLGAPIAKAIGKAGTAADIISAIGQKAAALARKAMTLIDEVAEFAARAAKLRTAVEVLSDMGKTLARKADDLTEAVLSLDKRVASNRQLLTVANDVDGLADQRKSILATLGPAEQRLQKAEAFWQRKQQLQTWAEGERASITAQQAKRALEVEGQLAEVQDRIIAVRQQIAQSPEMTKAWGPNAKATTTLNALQAEIRELEEQARGLVIRIDNNKKLITKKAAFEAAEDARNAASEAIDAADAEVRKIQAEIDSLKGGPEIKRLEAEEKKAWTEFDEASGEWKNRAHDFTEAQYASGGLNRQIDDLIDAGQEVPAELTAQFRAAQKKEAAANKAMTDAGLVKTNYRTAAENTSTQLQQERAKNLAQHNERGLDAQLQAAEAKAAPLREKLAPLEAEYDRAGKELQPISHPGMDTRKIPEYEAELNEVRAKLKAARAEEPELRKKFNETDAEQLKVRAELEKSLQPLEARKKELEGNLREAKRDWEQVAADRNPGNFQQWKLEVEGTDPFNDGPNEMRPMQEEVLNGRRQEKEIENQINAKRDQLGGETSESLQRKIADDEAELSTKKPEAEAARLEAEASKNDVEKAKQSASDAEADLERKKAELEGVKAQQSDVDAEMVRAKSEGGAPVDAIDEMTKRSQELSEKFKPGVVRSFEETVKGVAGAVGKKWEHFFNGQSPDEVAQGIKKSRDKVIRLKGELEQLMADMDNARETMRELKPKLDSCVTAHTYWTGPTS